jgi:hypothetical protein
MNLAEFVEESLSEILQGIRAAQKQDGGGAIGAQTYGAPQGLHHGGVAGMFTTVEFDVSVVAETTGSGKAGLKVWSVGFEGGGGHSSQQTSRVKFAVHIKIPQGDSAPE